ncbi:MAG: Rne/Rng family ribonuclease, partial [Desulfurivibrionaceae bacterium]
VALLEGGHIAELYIERERERGIVGNIYKGKVIRVLPGMQAAFVDIGMEKAAFLYVADVFDEMEQVELHIEGENGVAAPVEGEQ